MNFLKIFLNIFILKRTRFSLFESFEYNQSKNVNLEEKEKEKEKTRQDKIYDEHT